MDERAEEVANLDELLKKKYVAQNNFKELNQFKIARMHAQNKTTSLVSNVNLR